jgi:uncharacterized membrane protein (Fun14 family)
MPVQAKELVTVIVGLMVGVAILVGFSSAYYGYVNTINVDEWGTLGSVAVTLLELAYPLLAVAMAAGAIYSAFKFFTGGE